MNPNFPMEVIVIVLAKLDDLPSLLNCRLVCRSWNAECLSLLRRSRFRKTVGPSDLQKACQFGTHEGQCILLFRLKHTLYQEYTAEDEVFEDKCVSEFQTMSQDVSRLFQISGPDSIREYSLHYDPCRAKGLVAFNKFIGLIAPNLAKFDLALLLSPSLSSREAVQIMRKDPVLFPNLKELSCDISKHIESVLIENSHSLETLSLNSCDPFIFMPIEGLAAFFTLSKLKLYDDLRHPVQLLDNHNIRASQFKPILETFNFNAAYFNEDDMITAATTLLLYDKTLKSITVVLGLSPSSYNRTCNPCKSIALPFGFPVLPSLEHLGLKFNDMYYPCFVDPEEFNLNQVNFPALNSVEIPFGCMMLTPPPKPYSTQHRFLPSTTFPSVQKLTLLVEKYAFQYDPFLTTGTKSISWKGLGCKGRVSTCEHEHKLQISPQAYVELVARLFPSVTHLTVWNHKSRGSENNEQAVELVLKTVLQSESMLALGIETFQVNGTLGHNYLRNVLGGGGTGTRFTNKLTDVRKIRFESSWNADIFADDLLCFTLLEEHFPNVEQIEISPELVVGKTEVERWEKLRHASAKFPTWNIKLS